MEVTRHNFEETLPAVAEAIQGADFLSIDTEFTGLGIDPSQRIDLLDTPQERYVKQRSSAAQFLPIQIGLCAFAWNAETNTYLAKPFNFFIFPRPGSRAFNLDRTFGSQASSLDFLYGNSFDFNKWIRDGISYVSTAEEAEVRAKINAMKTDSDIPIEERNRAYVEGAIAKIRDWLQNSTEQVHNVPTPSSYHKRLIHQEVKKQFNGNLSTESTKLGVDIRKRLTEEKSANDDRVVALGAELDTLIGFRKVIDILSAAKKPIVGHNMLLDLCHFCHRFIQPLPDTFEEYKSVMHGLFPSIYDTKFVSSTNGDVQVSGGCTCFHCLPQGLTALDRCLKALVTNTTLGDLYARVCDAPFLMPAVDLAENFDQYKTGSKQLHEAGYDAYITGFSFLRLMGHVSALKEGESLNWQADFVEHCNNKMFVMRSDISFFDIGGEDDIPDRSNVFKLSNFPAKWKTSDIMTRFKDVGAVVVKWVDDTTCLLIIRDRKMVSFATALSQKKNSEFSLEPWSGASAAATATATATVTESVTVEIKAEEGDDDGFIPVVQRKRRRHALDSARGAADEGADADEELVTVRRTRKRQRSSEGGNGCQIM
ncbi:ribonuclease H-like domain-containing protein [Entophlyctis helioformis]|nr:ribonuclease H-like domain-containing protein [Entophlyctis helioformis]